MKKCFKCGEELPLSEFYKHPQMTGGYLGKCKDCTKKDVTENRNKNIDRIRAHDRKRGNRQTSEYFKEYRRRFPNQAHAQRKVAYEVSIGNLSAKSCESCGSPNTHAHHADYLKKLDIQWLCATCHKKWHQTNGPGLNRGEPNEDVNIHS